MPVNRHHRDAVTARRARVAQLYCRGVHQDRIAQECGVTQQQISLDLKEIRRVWQRTMAEEFDRLKAEQLAKLDAVEAEAWRGWRRSTRQAVKNTARLVRTPDGDRSETRRDQEDQAGDPRFLQVALSTVERRCKLIGADAPTRLELTEEQLRSCAPHELDAIIEGRQVPRLVTGYASPSSPN